MGKSKNDDYYLGFDLGGTKNYAVVYDESFKPIGKARTKTKGHQGKEAGLERIIKTAREALEEADVSKKKLAGIGIGCPGPVDYDAGVVLEAPNLGWRNVAVKKELEKEFDCPVFVLNDVDASVYGEYAFGAARGARCALGLFPGTGIGGGAVYEGEILRGKKSSCLEIGHMFVAPDGPLCGCGSRGCLEAVASRLAISSAAAAAAYRGEAPHLRERAGTDLSDIRSGALADSVEHGDEVVEQIIREAARWIGVGVANVVNLLIPDVVVLGGGLVEAMPKLFLKEAKASARSRVMSTFRDDFEIVVSELGDEAGVTGAAAWAKNRTS